MFTVPKKYMVITFQIIIRFEKTIFIETFIEN